MRLAGVNWLFRKGCWLWLPRLWVPRAEGDQGPGQGLAGNIVPIVFVGEQAPLRPVLVAVVLFVWKEGCL